MTVFSSCHRNSPNPSVFKLRLCAILLIKVMFAATFMVTFTVTLTATVMVTSMVTGAKSFLEIAPGLLMGITTSIIPLGFERLPKQKNVLMISPIDPLA